MGPAFAMDIVAGSGAKPVDDDRLLFGITLDQFGGTSQLDAYDDPKARHSPIR
jgi:hypothetical protein